MFELINKAYYRKESNQTPVGAATILALLLTVVLCLPNPADCKQGCLIAPAESVTSADGRTFSRFSKNGTLVEGSSSTTLCMSCHDGTVGSTLMLPQTADGDDYGIESSHPVDVPYPINSEEFVPITSLDERLTLEGGRVTCSTCHVMGPDVVKTSVPVEGSQLCLSCHIK